MPPSKSLTEELWITYKPEYNASYRRGQHNPCHDKFPAQKKQMSIRMPCFVLSSPRSREKPMNVQPTPLPEKGRRSEFRFPSSARGTPPPSRFSRIADHAPRVTFSSRRGPT